MKKGGELAEEIAIQRIAAKFVRNHPSLSRFMKGQNKFFVPSAERLHQIALLFERGGLGIVASEEDAFQFHKFAMELGHSTSQGIVGEYFERGVCCKRNPRGARRQYMRGAKAGDARSQYNLARVLWHGLLGESVDKIRALKYWQQAGDQKYPPALSALGYVYSMEEPGDGNNSNAAAKRSYAAAAALGDARAAFNLGLLYEKNQCPSANDEERVANACQWYERAVRLEHGRAADRLFKLRAAAKKKLDMANLAEIACREPVVRDSYASGSGDEGGTVVTTMLPSTVDLEGPPASIVSLPPDDHH